MNRRTFGLVVRLLAVVAAIYAFFSLRSQLPKEQTSRRPIPVKVVGTVCGSVVAENTTVPTGEKAPVDQNPSIRQAIETPGKPVPMRNQEECDRIMKMNGSVFSSEKGSFKIEFRKAL